MKNNSDACPLKNLDGVPFDGKFALVPTATPIRLNYYQLLGRLDRSVKFPISTEPLRNRLRDGIKDTINSHIRLLGLIMGDLVARTLDPRATEDAMYVNEFMLENGDKLHAIDVQVFAEIYGFICQCIPHHIGIEFYTTKNLKS